MAKLEMTLCIHWDNQVDSLYSTDADISSQAIKQTFLLKQLS